MVDIENIIEKGGKVADNLITSEEEERKIISEVHDADMRSDSWLSKNIRPLFLVFCALGLVALMVLESLGILISDSLKDLLSMWGGIAVSFYFGTRGWQHVERTKQKSEVIKARIDRKEKRLAGKEERKREVLTTLKELVKRKQNRNEQK